MPKIDAPTVVEHHARRRADIVAAAAELHGADGTTAVTPAAVAALAGLARSSVYQYYPSSGALVGAAVEEVFRRTLDGLESAMRTARTPAARLTAYVDASLDAAVAGHFPQGSYHVATIHELHEALAEPLVSALRDAGVRDAAGVAGLVGGVVSSAAIQVQHGEPVATVRRRLRTFVHGATGVG
jgi:AcrR family transcriptional regulator